MNDDVRIPGNGNGATCAPRGEEASLARTTERHVEFATHEAHHGHNEVRESTEHCADTGHLMSVAVGSVTSGPAREVVDFGMNWRSGRQAPRYCTVSRAVIPVAVTYHAVVPRGWSSTPSRWRTCNCVTELPPDKLTTEPALA